MKKGLTYLLMGLVVVGLSTASFAGGKKGHISGEVTHVDGAMVTVKDAHGDEHMLHVDNSTKTTGHIEVGAHVEAEATDSGHAKSVTVHEEKKHGDKTGH